MRVLPWSLLIHTGFLQLTSYLVRPASAYHALDLGVDPALLGLIAASFSVIPLLAAVAIGNASDRGHGTRLLVLGAILVIAGCAGLLLWSPSLPWLLVWNAALGVGHLLGIVGEQSRVVAEAVPGGADAAFGVFTFAGAIGQTLGPGIIAITGGSAAIPDTTLLFGAATVCAVVVAGTTVLLVRGSGRVVAVGGHRPTLRSAFADAAGHRTSLFGTVVLSMVLLAVIDLTSIYLPAWGVATAVPASVVGLLLTARSIAMTLSRPFLGPLTRRLGRRRVLLWSSVVGAVGIALLSAPLPLWLAVVALVVSGAGLGLGQPLTMSEIADLAPPNSRNTWLAIRLSGNALGQTVIPPSLGLLSAVLGPTGVFLVAGAGLGAATVTNVLAHRRDESGTDPSAG